MGKSEDAADILGSSNFLSYLYRKLITNLLENFVMQKITTERAALFPHRSTTIQFLMKMLFNRTFLIFMRVNWIKFCNVPKPTLTGERNILREGSMVSPIS